MIIWENAAGAPDAGQVLIWVAGGNGECTAHFWWHTKPVLQRLGQGQFEELRPGLVHDMVVIGERRRGVLRTLVARAREMASPDAQPYCADASLTSLGGMAAVRLGLTAEASFDHHRSDRAVYHELHGRAHGHLCHGPLRLLGGETST